MGKMKDPRLRASLGGRDVLLLLASKTKERAVFFPVTLFRSSRGLGFAIRRGRGCNQMPFTVSRVIEGGPAHLDGRLKIKGLCWSVTLLHLKMDLQQSGRLKVGFHPPSAANSSQCCRGLGRRRVAADQWFQDGGLQHSSTPPLLPGRWLGRRERRTPLPSAHWRGEEFRCAVVAAAAASTCALLRTLLSTAAHTVFSPRGGAAATTGDSATTAISPPTGVMYLFIHAQFTHRIPSSTLLG
uniref:Membrane associated guanylate kinase inverted n=1 Tax=Echinococcus granulosus TaxID=6210 RepID=A0A068X4Y8_ECHGR|nr:membrane associated guanylate kinase inverted [Echinococcus granulosus]